MLPKQHRLPGYRIPEIIKHGRRFHCGTATLIAVKTSKDHPSRFTVIVPMKLSKKAVIRNRIKRLMREAVHRHIFALTSGFDAIFIAKKELADGNLPGAETDILEALKKAAILTTYYDKKLD